MRRVRLTPQALKDERAFDEATRNRVKEAFRHLAEHPREDVGVVPQGGLVAGAEAVQRRPGVIGRGEQARQFHPQRPFERRSGGGTVLAVDRLGQAHHAIDGGQAGHAEQLAGDALDRVAGNRARRKAFGRDDAEPRMWQRIGSGVEHEMRGFLRRPQTKNG